LTNKDEHFAKQKNSKLNERLPNKKIEREKKSLTLLHKYVSKHSE